MGCPRCGEALRSYRLDGAETLVCESCSYVGVSVDHKAEPQRRETWDDAFDRFYEKSDGNVEGVSGDTVEVPSAVPAGDESAAEPVDGSQADEPPSDVDDQRGDTVEGNPVDDGDEPSAERPDEGTPGDDGDQRRPEAVSDDVDPSGTTGADESTDEPDGGSASDAAGETDGPSQRPTGGRSAGGDADEDPVDGVALASGDPPTEASDRPETTDESSDERLSPDTGD